MHPRRAVVVFGVVRHLPAARDDVVVRDLGQGGVLAPAFSPRGGFEHRRFIVELVQVRSVIRRGCTAEG